MITDRSINEDKLAPYDPLKPAGGKTFPHPAFTPTIVKVHFTAAGEIAVDPVLPITDAAGACVTGISNTSPDDTPYNQPDIERGAAV